MEAMISGSRGVALIVDGDQLASIHAENPEQMMPREPYEIRLLIGEGRDFMPLENSSRDEIVSRLRLATNGEEALTLTLALMDPEVSEDLRCEIVADLESLFQNDDVVCYVENILYSKPLPAEADLYGGLRLGRQAGTGQSRFFLERLKLYQSEIIAVREAWDMIPGEIFEGERDRWQNVAVREGLFREIITKYTHGDLQQLASQAAVLPALRNFSNRQNVLRIWIGLFIKFKSDATMPGYSEVLRFTRWLTNADEDQEFLAKEEASGRSILNRLFIKLCLFFIRNGENRENAIDLAKKTALNAYRKLSRLSEKPDSYTQLETLAVRMALLHLRRTKRELSTAKTEDLKFLSKDTVMAIHKLPKEQQRPMLLLTYGLKNPEIAEILGVSEQQVNTLIHLSRRNLGKGHGPTS